MLKWLKKIPQQTAETKGEGKKEKNEEKLQDGGNQVAQIREIVSNKKVKEEIETAEMEEEINHNDGQRREIDGEMNEDCQQSSDNGERRRILRNQLELVNPNKNIIRHLVLLNSMCLPLNYGDERSPHYKCALKNQLSNEEFANDPQDNLFWTKMAYYRNSLVGAITLNHQMLENSGGQSPSSSSISFRVNVLTLAVIPTFRRRGVASVLMEKAIDQCKEWGNVQQISLHCQSTNELARAFYRRYNFKEVEFIRNYYSCWRVPHPDAYRLKLVLSNQREEAALEK